VPCAHTRMYTTATIDLYVWQSPRDLDADRAEALLTGWHEAGGDPRAASAPSGWTHVDVFATTGPTIGPLSPIVPLYVSV